MSKPYTDSDLSNQISSDLTWRLREISDLKSAILDADDQASRFLLRSLVTISYAHWEGYVRFTAKKYLQHVSLRKYTYKDLEQQYLSNLFLQQLGTFCISKPSIADRCTLISEVRTCDQKRFSYVNESLIDTRSNLNHETLMDICLICGIEPGLFQDDIIFIDTILLKRRNASARRKHYNIYRRA